MGGRPMQHYPQNFLTRVEKIENKSFHTHQIHVIHEYTIQIIVGDNHIPTWLFRFKPNIKKSLLGVCCWALISLTQFSLSLGRPTNKVLGF